MKSFIYLTPLLLYFPPLVPNIETQPFFSLAFASIGLIYGGKKRPVISLAGITFAALLWVCVLIISNRDFSSAIGLSQLLVGPAILFGAIALRAPPPSRRIMAIASVYLFLVAMLEILYPVQYSALANFLLSRASVADGHRGVSLLTPEPTYAAISALYLVLIAFWSAGHWGHRMWWLEWLLILCLLATGSTYLVIFAIALAIVRWPIPTAALTCLSVVFAITSSSLITDNDESVRIVVALSRLLSVDFQEILPSISNLDSSLGTRVVINFASFLTPFFNPIGLGLDCRSAIEAINSAGFYFAYDNPVIQEVITGGCLKPQSYLAAALLATGVFGIFFILFVLRLLTYSTKAITQKYWMPPLIVAAVILTVQGQITSPIPWLLVYASVSRYSFSLARLGKRSTLTSAPKDA